MLMLISGARRNVKEELRGMLGRVRGMDVHLYVIRIIINLEKKVDCDKLFEIFSIVCN